MNRRGFLGALAAVIAAGKAAPQLLAKLAAPAPKLGYNDWPLGLGEAIESASVHRLSTSTYPQWEAGYAAAPPQQAEVAMRRMSGIMQRRMYGEPIPWSVWDHASRRHPSIGYAAWERRVLG